MIASMMGVVMSTFQLLGETLVSLHVQCLLQAECMLHGVRILVNSSVGQCPPTLVYSPSFPIQLPSEAC